MSNAVEKAKEQVTKLMEAERRLSERLAVKQAELAAAGGDLGESTLKAELAGAAVDLGLLRCVSDLRAEVDATQQAIDAARRERLSAIPLVWRAEASELVEKAEKLEGEANSRQEKTDKLLAQLEEWEGVRYVPSRPGDHSPLLGNQQGGAPTVITVAVPKTDYLRLEATQLRERAAALETKRPVRSGRATGASAKELLGSVLGDPMVLGPTAASVLAWTAEQEAKHGAESAALRHKNHEGWETRNNPIRYTIIWKNGELLTSECSAVREAA